MGKESLSRNVKITAWEDDYLKLQADYNLETVPVRLGKVDLTITKVANIDELLDRVSEVDQIPFWAELWPAAIGLARFIHNHKQIFSKKRLLELGAGVGLAGIAAKLAGANVVQSDFIPAAFKFIEVNCRRNNLAVSEFLLADWRKFPVLPVKYEQIIGADILYEKDLHQDLITLFQQVLKTDGSIWLADPGRDHAKRFIDKVTKLGWRVRCVQMPVSLEQQAYLIDIYQINSQGTEATILR